MRLFKKKGFDGATVEEIADAVDLSPRTFFRYFPSKDDVVFAADEEDLAALREGLRLQPADIRPFEALRDTVVCFAEGLEHRREEFAIRARLVTSSATLQARARTQRELWAEALAQDLAEREGQPLPSEVHRLLASVSIAALGTALQTWGMDEAVPSLGERIQASLEGLHAALA